MLPSRSILVPAWVLSILAVIYLSLQPGVDVPAPFYQSDKVGHYIAYGWLGLLPALAFASRRSVLLSAGAMILLGLLLEYCQSFVPQRMASAADMIANTLGVFTGLAAASLLRRSQRRAARQRSEGP